MLPLIGYLQSVRYGIAIAMLSALLLFSCQSIKTAEPAESPAEDDMTGEPFNRVYMVMLDDGNRTPQDEG